MANAGARGRPTAPLVLSAEERAYWRDKFVVTVLLGRCLSDVASFCDVLDQNVIARGSSQSCRSGCA
jgi:hypothetical protein